MFIFRLRFTRLSVLNNDSGVVSGDMEKAQIDVVKINVVNLAHSQRFVFLV